MNLLAKLNGKKQYAEIEQFDLLKENKLPLRALNISKGGKITTGGESKTLFTSLKSVNEGIVGLQKKATFKSPINALEFISENIVAVGLEDSSLWLIKLDTNEKTKIFKSKGWKPGKVIKTITNTFVKGINFVEYSSKNRTLIASLEKELIVIDFDKINDGKKAFTNKFELNNLETVAKDLKNKYACGGTAKEGYVFLQGDHRDTIKDTLVHLGFAADTIELH